MVRRVKRPWADVFQDRLIDTIIVAFGLLAALTALQLWGRRIVERVFG